jgi:hypothetical protein
LDQIGFTFSTVSGQKVSGVVNLYILVFGNMDLNLVKRYPGIRFIWGPSHLKSFIGSVRMTKLLCNSRFKLISIFRDDGLHQQLASLDPQYHKTKITEEDLISTLYCLPETKMETIQEYLAKEKHYGTRDLVQIQEESTGKYRVQFRENLNQMKRKRDNVSEHSPLQPHKKTRMIYRDRKFEEDTRIAMRLSKAVEDIDKLSKTGTEEKESDFHEGVVEIEDNSDDSDYEDEDDCD